MRTYRNYDDGSGPEADADLKPDTGSVTGVRAWLMPQENGLPAGFATAGGPWTLAVEDGAERESIVGEFDALVAAAGAAGAVEFFVWSTRQQTYERFDAETVRIID